MLLTFLGAKSAGAILLGRLYLPSFGSPAIFLNFTSDNFSYSREKY